MSFIFRKMSKYRCVYRYDKHIYSGNLRYISISFSGLKSDSLSMYHKRKSNGLSNIGINPNHHKLSQSYESKISVLNSCCNIPIPISHFSRQESE